MNTLLKSALVGAAAVTAFAGLAQPAMANDVNVGVGDGTVRYTDSSDSFCAQAHNTEGLRSVTVKLTPVNGVGPTHHWTDKNTYYSDGNSGATCRSLATAYEDTQYRAEVWTYWGERGTTVKRGTYTFYS